MRMEAYSVYDKGVEAYMTPFFVRSKGEAIRSFCDACTDGKTSFCKHPEDYTLFYIGRWDDANGSFECEDAGPIKVITALEAVAIRQQAVQ